MKSARRREIHLLTSLYIERTIANVDGSIDVA